MSTGNSVLKNNMLKDPAHTPWTLPKQATATTKQDPVIPKNNTDISSEEKKYTRQEVIKTGQAIAQSQTIYEDEKRIHAFTMLSCAVNYFGLSFRQTYKTFPGKRCEPPLNEREIVLAEENAKKLMAAVVENEREVKRLKEQGGAITPEIQEEAARIYNSGKFIQYCKDAFKKVWYGDEFGLEAILYVLACLYVENADIGIHLFVTGNTQDGKSLMVKRALWFAHPKNYKRMTMTPMYLYHSKPGTIHSQMVIFSDDTTLKEETARIYRDFLTSWHDGTVRGSVDNMKGEEHEIPPRLSLILTGIDSVVLTTDEAQDESRFMTIEIRRSVERKKEIKKFKQSGDRTQTIITHELMVVKAVWNMISNTIVEPHRIYDNDLEFRDDDRYRTLVKCHALLSGRVKTNEEDDDAIQKFWTYTKPMINATTAAFNRYEQALSDALTNEWVDMKEYQEKLGIKPESFYRAIRGIKGAFDRPTGGLLTKSKDVQVREISEMKKMGDNNRSVKKHQIRKLM